MVVSAIVGTSVIGVTVSAISVAVIIRIVTSVSTIPIVRIVSTITGVSVSEGHAHSPSESKSHADAHTEPAPTVAIRGSIIGIVVVPAGITIGEPPQVRGVIIFIRIGIVVVVIYNHRRTFLAVLVQGIELLVLVHIKCFTPIGCVRYTQHFRLLLHPVLLIVTHVFISDQGFGI